MTFDKYLQRQLRNAGVANEAAVVIATQLEALLATVSDLESKVAELETRVADLETS